MAEAEKESNDAGDEGVIARLFMEHRERLWRLVHFRLDSRLRGRMDVEDILQEAFLAAGQRGKHMPAEEGRVYVWIRLIVLQTMTDLHRRHIGADKRDASREVAGKQKMGLESTRSIIGQLVGDITSPSTNIRREEMSDQMNEALSKLSDSDGEVLVLRHFEELSNAEVAEVLNISVKAASIRYVRALTRFKEILKTLPDFSSSRLS